LEIDSRLRCIVVPALLKAKPIDLISESKKINQKDKALMYKNYQKKKKKLQLWEIKRRVSNGIFKDLPLKEKK